MEARQQRAAAAAAAGEQQPLPDGANGASSVQGVSLRSDPTGNTQMGEGTGNADDAAGESGGPDTGDRQSTEEDDRRKRLNALMSFSKPPPRTPDAGVEAAEVEEKAVEGEVVQDEGEGRRRTWKLRERELKEREAKAKGEVKRLRREGDALVRECR